MSCSRTHPGPRPLSLSFLAEQRQKGANCTPGLYLSSRVHNNFNGNKTRFSLTVKFHTFMQQPLGPTACNDVHFLIFCGKERTVIIQYEVSTKTTSYL